MAGTTGTQRSYPCRSHASGFPESANCSPLNLGGAVVRETLDEGMQRTEAGTRALDVGVVDHDVAECLRRVERLVPAVRGHDRRGPTIDERKIHVPH